MDLTGKVAVVTGSGRGLGLAYASELARRGAAVVVNDVDADVAGQAVAAIAAEGGNAVAEVVPVGSSDAAQALVDRAVREFGRLDILVNNAGILRDSTLWKMTDEDFDAVIATHLRGTFTCTRAAAIKLREQGEGGRIICVGSPTGQVGNFGQTNYAAAGITGQAVGIGGDRLALWSHPTEVVVEFADGTGWSPDAIAQAWPEKFAPSQQTVGQQLPQEPGK